MSSRSLHLLVVELPGATPRHYLLDAASIRIGRVEGNSIIIEESAVSGRHCELRRRGTGYELADLGSTNGTRVNGESVSSDVPRRLHDGDAIVFGLHAKARFVRVVEIRDQPMSAAEPSGAATRRLERPEINPVAAAVAKATQNGAKAG